MSTKTNISIISEVEDSGTQKQGGEKKSITTIKDGKSVVAFLVNMEDGSSKLSGLMVDLVLSLCSLNSHEDFREEMTCTGGNAYLKFIRGVNADLLMNNNNKKQSLKRERRKKGTITGV